MACRYDAIGQIAETDIIVCLLVSIIQKFYGMRRQGTILIGITSFNLYLMISKTFQYNSKPEKSRLSCPLNRSMSELFFSLVDYRNNYFTSSNIKKIIEFYSSFKNRDQLIQWMRERPKGVANIHEVDGDKDIIVVIPTADFNGNYAKECRDNIFKGLHIIFVESGGRGDFYFNYAHNCNVGIRRAMEYNPKWVVLSNDDINKVDDVKVLRHELNKLDKEKVDFVVCEPSHGYHSTPVKILYPNRLALFLYFRKTFKDLSQSFKEIVSQLKSNFIFTLINTSRTDVVKISRKERFKLNLLIKFFFHDDGIDFFQMGAFGIMSGNLANKLDEKPFNEDYINAVEDIDLSYRIMKNGYKTLIIHYNIRPDLGFILGSDSARDARSIAGRLYLFSILQKDLAVTNRF